MSKLVVDIKDVVIKSAVESVQKLPITASYKDLRYAQAEKTFCVFNGLVWAEVDLSINGKIVAPA